MRLRSASVLPAVACGGLARSSFAVSGLEGNANRGFGWRQRGSAWERDGPLWLKEVGFGYSLEVRSLEDGRFEDRPCLSLRVCHSDVAGSTMAAGRRRESGLATGLAGITSHGQVPSD